jgi:hypothetical protein
LFLVFKQYFSLARITVDELKKTVGKLANFAEHTMKALSSFNPNSVVDHRGKLLEEPVDPQVKFGPPETKELPPINVRLQAAYPQGMKRVPNYVSHNFPNVFPPTQNDPETSFLPKIPGSDANYGMLYNRPETEAERKMNELWLARRRQEAFDYKTQQQLAIVMDRLALHKARMENDTLRKQETEAMLKAARARPKTTSDLLIEMSKTTNNYNNNNNTVTFTGSQSAASSPVRYRGINHKLMKELDGSPDSSPERRGGSRSRSPGSRRHHHHQKPAETSNNNTGRSKSRKDLFSEENLSVTINDGEVRKESFSVVVIF